MVNEHKQEMNVGNKQEPDDAPEIQSAESYQIPSARLFDDV